MPIGDLGKEQFERAITKLRNLSIVAALGFLITFREEVLANDEFGSRTGFDDATRDHFVRLLQKADKMRRAITHNPSNKTLGEKIAEAIDFDKDAEIGEKPFSSDEIQGQSRGLFALPWALDGSDPNLPLASQINLRSPMSITILTALDSAIVDWTRLPSAERSKGITVEDSMRMYGNYTGILGWLMTFGGDANRIDVAQVLPASEPQGPESSPNRKNETIVASGVSTASK